MSGPVTMGCVWAAVVVTVASVVAWTVLVLEGKVTPRRERRLELRKVRLEERRLEVEWQNISEEARRG